MGKHINTSVARYAVVDAGRDRSTSLKCAEEVGGYGRYVGRIGSLAVALGIGLATTSSFGMGIARADDDTITVTGSRSETGAAESRESTRTRKSTRASKASETDSASAEDNEAGPPEVDAGDVGGSPTGPRGTAERDIAPGHQDETVNDADRPEDESTSDHSRNTASAEPAGPTDETSSTGFRNGPTAQAPSGQRLSAIENADRSALGGHDTTSKAMVSRERLIPRDSQSHSTASIQESIPVVNTSATVIDVVNAVVANLLKPLVTPGSGGPPDSPLLLTLLAWARRQSSRDEQSEAKPVALAAPAPTLDDSSARALSAASSSGPVANGDVYVTDEDVPVSGQVLANDVGTGLYVGNPGVYDLGYGKGIMTIAQNGAFTFVPGTDSNESIVFTYVLFETASSGYDLGNITVTVNPVNDPVTAIDDLDERGYEDTENYGFVLGNDITQNPDRRNDEILSAVPGTFTTANGVVTIDEWGEYTYTPHPNFVGSDSFTYTVTDGTFSDVGLVEIWIAPTYDDAPTAVNDAANVAEDTERDFTSAVLTQNDTDLDRPYGDTLSVHSVAGAVNGTVVLNANGTVTFTPSANYSGPASFTYRVKDSEGLISANSATVNVTVDPVNDAPTAVDDTKTLTEDFERTFTIVDLLWNDPDPDKASGDTLSFHSVADATNGTVMLNVDGTVTFKPTTNYNGPASFTYRVKDTAGAISTNSATVSLTINPSNDPPAAVNDTKTVNANTSQTFTAAELVANDNDPDKANGDILSVHSVTSAVNGTVVLNTNGTVTFTPTANYSGPASFIYRVKDAAGLVSTNSATVAIHVNGAPTAVNDSKTLTEDIPRTFTTSDLLWNDTDPNKSSGDVLSFHSVAGATHGTVVLTGEGTILFTPAANYSGPASFTYRVKDSAGTISANSATVSLTINPVNDPPVAVNDTKTLSEDVPRTFTTVDLLWNDTDPERTSGDTLAFHSVAGAVNGTVVLNIDGTITFTPATNYNGAASFTYRVKDSAGAISANSATVSLAINPVNDAPIAVNDTKTVNANTSYTFTAAELVGNDTDPDKPYGDTLSVHSVAGATNGTVVLNANGTVTFTPTANYAGPASFTYRVKDAAGLASATAATVAITVNGAPTAVNDSKTLTEDITRTFTTSDLLWNDTDPNKSSGDVLSFHSVGGAVNGTVALNANGTVTFTPTANYNGPASFTYQVKDTAGLLSANSATVSLTINPVNDTPTAVNDTKTVSTNTSYTFTAAELVGNDTDPDKTYGDTLSVHSVAGATNGTVVLNANGTVTFTPTANYSGAASFTYRVKDAAGLTSATAATVAISVRPPNSAPTAVNDSKTLTEDTPRTFSAAEMVWNDIDPDKAYGDTLRIYSVDNADWGTVVLNGDGTVTFTPTANYFGGASFTYTVADAAGLLSANSATVSLNITPVNDAPVAVNDSYATDEGAQLVVFAGSSITPGVLGNDPNPDYESPTVSVVSNPSHGVLQLDADGGFTYTPNAGYRGPDSFTYRAFDGTSYSNAATVTVTVKPVITATDSIVLGASQWPRDILITPDGSRAYVISTSEHSLDVIDIDPQSATYNMATRVLDLAGNSSSIEPTKLAITPDGKTLFISTNYFEYVFNPVTQVQTPNYRMFVVDVDPQSAGYHSATTITVGDHAPQALAVTPDGTRVYVTRSNGDVSVIDATASSGGQITQISTPGTDLGSIDISPDGLRAYVTNYYTDAGISVIDIDPTSAMYNTIVATIPGVAGAKALAVSPTGKIAYVAAESSVLAIDLNPASSTFHSVIGETLVYNPLYPAYGPRNVTFSPDGTLVYITVLGTNLAFDAVATSPTFNQIVSEYVGGDGQIAVTPDGTRAYGTVVLGSYFGSTPPYTGSVTVIDLGSGTYGEANPL